jgi:hypothetical protein
MEDLGASQSTGRAGQREDRRCEGGNPREIRTLRRNFKITESSRGEQLLAG